MVHICKMVLDDGKVFCPGNLQKQFSCSFVLICGNGDKGFKAAHARVPGGRVREDVGPRLPVIGGLEVVRV
jgi:hypothetical protein